MAHSEKNVLKALGDLIATCNDSQEGFSKAAKGVRDDQLRDLLIGIARQRTDFVDELKPALESLGGEPVDDGHFGGILHRGWVDLETRIDQKDDMQIVAEARRGEETTARHYEHALEQDLSDEHRALVRRQHLAVRQTLERLRSLETVPSIK